MPHGYCCGNCCRLAGVRCSSELAGAGSRLAGYAAKYPVFEIPVHFSSVRGFSYAMRKPAFCPGQKLRFIRADRTWRAVCAGLFLPFSPPFSPVFPSASPFAGRAAGSVLCPVFVGRLPHAFLEQAREVLRIPEPELVGDFADRLGRVNMRSLAMSMTFSWMYSCADFPVSFFTRSPK